ncbi:MAG: hypothetical protein KIT76_11445 [Pseudolabrys sp.]|nr:hypothetical protein [Pseudolabrys sp.]
MTSHTRRLCLAVTLGVLAMTAPACAQENLDQGKSAQQLFASDCAICHKSPQGLAARAGSSLFGLDGFLREHYTVSRQSAAILARYLQSVGGAPDEPRRSSRRSAKPAEKKPDDSKKSDAKPEAKPEAKSEAKSDSKSEAKVEAKPETKPETKPEAKPEADKPAKSD